MVELSSVPTDALIAEIRSRGASHLTVLSMELEAFEKALWGARKKWTNEAIADHCQVSEQTVQHWLMARVKPRSDKLPVVINILEELASADVPLRDLPNHLHWTNEAREFGNKEGR